MAFHSLEALDNLHDGYQKAFKVGKLNLLLVQMDGQAFLIENRCPHMDVPLEHAEQVPGQALRCKAHGIAFELCSGKAKGPLGDTLDSLNKYSIAYDGNMLGVDV